MMPRNLDLRLSLDLGLASQGSLTSSTTTSSSPAFPWSAELNSIVCAVGAAEDQGRTSTSPDSSAALSSASGKRELDRTGSGAAAGSDEDDGADGAGGRKKLRLSKDQAAVLEECFKTHSTLNPKQKVALANRLGLRPRQVEVWFQNRRARTKLKQTEVDCDYLKRWCDRLADENKRLEKELADLRALKAAPSPASALQRSSSAAAPVATLTMCPSCRRVATAGAPPHHQQCHPKSNIPTSAAPAVAGNVLPSHCQFFPSSADRTSQSTWNAAAPLVTRELFSRQVDLVIDKRKVIH